MSKTWLVKIIVPIVTIGFLINLIWEIAQMPFYRDFDPLRDHFWLCFFASLGDVFIILVLYAIVAHLRKSLFWIGKIKWVDILFVVMLATFTAIAIEKWALSTGQWQYALAMPKFFGTNVGLFPILQMMLLPILTFYISGRFIRALNQEGEININK
ncbi:MAG: hypothetical protein Q8R08_02520 [bacterium]|nr:hypothetical protein [bacterium]